MESAITITEGVVSGVMKKLGDALIQEAVLLHGVRRKVECLISELRWMESFLKVAHAKQRNGDELVKNWVRVVRDVAYRAEDVIDTFMLEIEPLARLQRRTGGAMGSIVRYAALPFELIPRHKVGSGIKDLKAKIEQIKASRERYGLLNLPDHSTTATGESSRSADDALQARRRISPHLVDDNDTVVVGLDSHVNRIIHRLLDDANDIPWRCVLSIVGTGGLGKTTLATKVYNSRGIKTRFSARAWVSVSQDYRIDEIVKKIAKQVKIVLDDVDDLKVTLRTFLKERRYLIVLDDVWRPDMWVQIKTVLPEVNNGSRVLVTTRSIDVARSADPRINPYHLPFLNEEESWELFLKTAFPVSCCCPEELEGVGRRLVRRCGGLPLALHVLGGLLSRKDPIPAAWMRVGERMNWASTQDGGDCLKILGLSYDELPHHHLRSCFLYLAAFPEDMEIKTNTLIRLWVAEGFIPRTEAQTVEETAASYLEELAQRSMIQVVSIKARDGGVSIFRLHDLFRDLCIREAREDGFLNVHHGSDDSEMIRRGDDTTTLRRLALHNLTTDDVKKNWCPLSSHLRSISVFGGHEAIPGEIFNGLRLLRVIHFEQTKGLASLPEEMKSMIHMRYLKVNGSIGELPSSLGKLFNLHTLDVGATEISKLPESLRKIQTLRHLILPTHCECPPNIIGNLTNLQKLYMPSARGGWIDERELEKLVNIRELGVDGLMASQGEVFLLSLPKMKRLSSLELRRAELISTEFLTIFSTHNHLLALFLEGPISQLPGSRGGFPPNLACLTLSGSKLEQDPLATLEKLPNLVLLELADEAYVGEEMACTAGGFPRLRTLVLDRLGGLQHWRVERGAMPTLNSLSIRNCSRLTMVPEGLQHVASLRSLEVQDEQEEFRGRLQRDVGEVVAEIEGLEFKMKQIESGMERSADEPLQPRIRRATPFQDTSEIETAEAAPSFSPGHLFQDAALLKRERGERSKESDPELRMVAERAVSLALEKLSGPLIQKAAASVHGVRDRLEWLRAELESMECFLRGADYDRWKGDLFELRKVAQRAEAIIDAFMLEIEPKTSTRLTRRIIRYADFSLKPRACHKVVAEIKGLEFMMKQIESGMERSADEPLQPRIRRATDDAAAVVGFDAPKEAIMGQLLDASIKRRSAMSIVGVGGLGKTTLAKKVYSSREIRAHFDACAWVSVSQDYRAGAVMKSIAEQVMGKTMAIEPEGMEVTYLAWKLHKFLGERRYFIVLDDVWGTDVWEQARSVLPDAEIGSRVLLTTRSMEVARSADPLTLPYKLASLSDDDCWELFFKKAFLEDADVMPSDPDEELEDEELVGIGRRLVKRCSGLPLALQLVGGLLSTKEPQPRAWMSVAELMDRASTYDGDDCLMILGLCYDDLPHHHLRSCFLYLGAFPEDLEINARQLIQLWIAEGFIPQAHGRMMEDTAKGYLEELAQRYLIQDVSRDLADASVVQFRIHDLVRGWCQREAREVGFLSVYNTYSIRHDHTQRRLALNNLTTDDVKDCCPPPNLSSLLVFDTEVASEIFTGLEFLRVIHFRGTSKCGFERLPKEMESMIHLRYLRLGGCRDIKELPPSIGNLHNLQTLDVADTTITSLPKELGKIQTMRHLYLPGSCDCPPIGNLTNLQTLRNANARGGWIEGDLEKLSTIRDLRVHGLRYTQMTVFVDSIGKLKCLSSLELLYTETVWKEFITTVLSSLNDLQRLYLDGPMSHRALPYSHEFPPNLTKLTLRRSELKQDPMAALERLPRLRVLELDMLSYIGKELICTAGGFPSLRILYLAGLEGLQDWRVEAGAMPNLTSLTIRNCWRLPMLPEGLQHITLLRHLEVSDDREEFRGRFLPGKGEDWYKIQHVASVIVRDPRFE